MEQNLEQKIVNLMDEIGAMTDFDFNEMIGWDVLLAWPVGETRNINGSINTKVYQSENLARFVTQIPPLVQFERHWHDCAESNTVMAGTLYDEISRRTWTIGQTAVFSKGQKHIPLNPSPTMPLWLQVDFNR